MGIRFPIEYTVKGMGFCVPGPAAKRCLVVGVFSWKIFPRSRPGIVTAELKSRHEICSGLVRVGGWTFVCRSMGEMVWGSCLGEMASETRRASAGTKRAAGEGKAKFSKIGAGPVGASGDMSGTGANGTVGAAMFDGDRVATATGTRT